MLDGSIAGGVGQRRRLRDVEPPPPAARVLHREPRDQARRRRGASRANRSRRRSRCPSASACGSRSIRSRRTTTSPRSPAGSRTSASKPPPNAQEARGAHARGAAVGAAARLAQRPRRVAVRQELRRRAGARRSRRPQRRRVSDAHRARRARRAPCCCGPTARCCSRSGRRASRTRATGNSPAASSSPASRRAHALDRELHEELGIDVRARVAVARAGVRLSARARRAPLLPRVRVGRRARRPRRPGVRVADARHATPSRRCCPPTRASSPRSSCRRLRHHAARGQRRGRVPRARASARFDGGLAPRAAARQDWPLARRIAFARALVAARASLRRARAVERHRGRGARGGLRRRALDRGDARAARRRVRRTCWSRRRATRAEELARAGALDLDFAVLGPVAPTPTHPDATPLGWDGFARIAQATRVPVYRAGRA